MAGITPTRFETTGEMLLVGLRKHYTFGGEAGIEKQWWDFVPKMESIPDRVPDVTYGVCLDFNLSEGFDYLSAVEVTKVSETIPGMDVLRLPARRYAVFTHEGHYSTLPQTFEAIIREWVPTVTNTDNTAPNFERYNRDFCPETGIGGIEIWFPLTD